MLLYEANTKVGVAVHPKDEKQLLGRPDSTTTEPPELPETFESPEPEDSEEEKSSYETTDEGGDIAELILIM
ncbi:15533_t:CDS:2, partial [Rhizophagus irregularis]